MVWLVVTVNGVYYIGDSLEYTKIQNATGHGSKRFAKISNCRMINSRWGAMDYPSCLVHVRYIIFANKVQLRKSITYKEIEKWFKKFPESERIK